MNIHFTYSLVFYIIDCAMWIVIFIGVILFCVFGANGYCKGKRNKYFMLFLSFIGLVYVCNILSVGNNLFDPHMQVIYIKESDESKVFPSVRKIRGFDENNNFNIRFSISDDGNITNSHQDDYVDISVKFYKAIDFQRITRNGIIEFILEFIVDIIFNVIFDYNSIYYIEDLKILLVHNGKVYELNKQDFFHKYSRFKNGINSRPNIDIMNIAIKEYKLMKSNYEISNNNNVANTTKLN